MGILGRVPAPASRPSAPPTLPEFLATLRRAPERAAVLLDVDGTLAPIVRHAEDAHVPEPTRAPLIEIAKRYGVVACVSGRQAAVARRIVSLGSIAYVGNHGSELLRPGAHGPSPPARGPTSCTGCGCGPRTRW